MPQYCHDALELVWDFLAKFGMFLIGLSLFGVREPTPGEIFHPCAITIVLFAWVITLMIGRIRYFDFRWSWR